MFEWLVLALSKEQVCEGSCLLDDILIHTQTQEEHDRILESVREALIRAGMHLKVSGCAFNVDRVDPLGS